MNLKERVKYIIDHHITPFQAMSEELFEKMTKINIKSTQLAVDPFKFLFSSSCSNKGHNLYDITEWMVISKQLDHCIFEKDGIVSSCTESLISTDYHLNDIFWWGREYADDGLEDKILISVADSISCWERLFKEEKNNA